MRREGEGARRIGVVGRRSVWYTARPPGRTRSPYPFTLFLHRNRLVLVGQQAKEGLESRRGEGRGDKGWCRNGSEGVENGEEGVSRL